MTLPSDSVRIAQQSLSSSDFFSWAALLLHRTTKLSSDEMAKEDEVAAAQAKVKADQPLQEEGKSRSKKQ